MQAETTTADCDWLIHLSIKTAVAWLQWNIKVKPQADSSRRRRVNLYWFQGNVGGFLIHFNQKWMIRFSLSSHILVSVLHIVSCKRCTVHFILKHICLLWPFCTKLWNKFTVCKNLLDNNLISECDSDSSVVHSHTVSHLDPVVAPDEQFYFGVQSDCFPVTVKPFISNQPLWPTASRPDRAELWVDGEPESPNLMKLS